jgi:nitrate reductase assembly molybdenum cofactor insertion protein NarJ
MRAVKGPSSWASASCRQICSILVRCSAIEQQGRSLDAEYDRVFGLASLVACPPYEAEFHAAGETFFRSQQMADIAGFYAAFGLEASRNAGERPTTFPWSLSSWPSWR